MYTEVSQREQAFGPPPNDYWNPGWSVRIVWGFC
jgi:hypothetical protein